MGFTLDDDEDDFWGDATTFGCARVPVAPSRRGAQIRIRPRATLFKPAAARAPQPPRSLADGSPPRLHPRRAIDTLCKQAEEQAKSQPARHAAPVASGVAPTSAPSPGAPPTRPSTTLDAHLRPGAGGPARAPLSAGSGELNSGAFHPGGGGATPVNPESALLAKDRELGQKEAHLKMLRARLEMSERDMDAMRRKLEAAERRAAAATASASVNPGASPGAGSGFPSDARHRSARSPPGPAPMEVSNAAALAEARAEVARLRSQAAFKEEEAEEARRREEVQRDELSRAQRESMQLAAEVRAERRRAAEAEAGRGARGGSKDETRGANGNTRRVDDEARTTRAFATGDAHGGGEDVERDGADAGGTAGVASRRRLPSPPPRPPSRSSFRRPLARPRTRTRSSTPPDARSSPPSSPPRPRTRARFSGSIPRVDPARASARGSARGV